jgi:hypothetical protein
VIQKNRSKTAGASIGASFGKESKNDGRRSGGNSTFPETALISWIEDGPVFFLVELPTDVDGELADENQKAPTSHS